MERLLLYLGIAVLGDWLLSEYGQPYTPDPAKIAASVLVGFGLEALLLEA